MLVSSLLPVRKARFVDTPSPAPFWRVLHRLADAAYPQWVEALSTVLAQTGVDISLSALTAAVASGPPTLLVTLLEEAWRVSGPDALREVLATRVPLLLADAAQATARTADLPLAFATTDAAVVLAADAHSAQLVRAIDETTRTAIRGAVSMAFQAQQNTGQLARTLRGVVGLTPRQAKSLVRYSAGLAADGVPPSQIEQLVARHRERLIGQRVTVLVRTETINTVSMGQQLLWRQAQVQGLIDATLKRFWIITPDDRLCPICRPIPAMNPGGVGIEEPFQTPVGPVLFPTVHSQCRCAVALTDRSPE